MELWRVYIPFALVLVQWLYVAEFVIVLIPGVNQIFRFFLGGFGNRWAWKVYGEDRMGEFNKLKQVEQFNKTQKGWNIAGIVVLSIIVVIVLISLISEM